MPILQITQRVKKYLEKSKDNCSTCNSIYNLIDDDKIDTSELSEEMNQHLDFIQKQIVISLNI